MTVYLDKNEVASRLGIKPKTAASLMMEMHPIPISGNTRKRYRVTEENLEQWMLNRMIGKPVKGSINKCSKKRLGRR